MAKRFSDDRTLQPSFFDDVIKEVVGFSDLDDRQFHQELSNIVTRKLFGSGTTQPERLRLIREIYNRTRGLDILQPLLDDPSVTEIMVNGPNHVFYEKDGVIHQAEIVFDNMRHLFDVVSTLFSRLNRPLSLHNPIADARLKDGSRANAAIPPVAPDGPVLTLRKFTGVRHTPEALIETGFLTTESLVFLQKQVRERRSVFICGGTGTGKTTLLNVLSSFIPDHERIVTIEDSIELQLVNQPNLVRLEARLPGPDGEGEITISQLIRASLRMRPDRIIVGEVRGREAADLIQAMNTGHPGSLCTGHGNSCRDMIVRLSNLVLDGSTMPLEAVRQTLASVIDIMVHISRVAGGRRKVDEICAVESGADGQPQIKLLYAPREGDGELVSLV
ncbi:MAG: CpaF family protein [Fastidiosipilaceae bacterium]|jgi:pilus assembly protein CpaF